MEARIQAIVVSNLEEVRRLEGAMAEYYIACSEVWPDRSSLWMSLALDEEKHQRVIGDLIGLVRKYPRRFRPGLAVEPTAVQTYITTVNEKASDILKGKADISEALSFALQMEESILVGRFFEIVRSEHPSFSRFVELLTVELEEHRGKLTEELDRTAG